MHFLILYEKVSKYTRDKMIILKDILTLISQSLFYLSCTELFN